MSNKKQAALNGIKTEQGQQSEIRKNQISNIEERIKELNINMERDISSSFFSQSKNNIRKSYSEQIEALQNQLNKLVDGGLNSIEKPDLTFESIDAQYTLMIDLVDRQISENQTEISRLESIISKQSKATGRALQTKIHQIEQLSSQVDNDIKRDLKTLKTQHKSTLDEIDELNDLNFNLEKEIDILDSELEEVYLSNQIYRMAGHVDGTNKLSKIQPKTVTLVALIWFGSLAFICSIIGPVLIILGLHLRFNNWRKEPVNQYIK